jgi:hypothetical protein
MIRSTHVSYTLLTLQKVYQSVGVTGALGEVPNTMVSLAGAG